MQLLSGRPRPSARILSAAALLLGASDALALGSFGFESLGFLKRSPDRSDSSTWLTVEPSFKGMGAYFQGELNLRGAAYVSDVSSSFTVDAGDTYVATTPAFGGPHGLTLGRKLQNWSQADRYWSLGLWEPRYLWDTFRPQTDGLTGVFYSYESRTWKFRGFASPMTIPDRGYPVHSVGGKLVSSSNDFIPPYDQLSLLNREVDIRYNLEVPPLSDLMLKPGAAISVRYDENDGRYATLSSGVLPSHQLDLAAELALNASTLILDATIRPRSYYHQLTTLELARAGQDWSIWGSLSRESPIQPSTPAEWTAKPIGPAWIASFGGSAHVGRSWVLGAGGLWIDENKRVASEQEAALHLPPRFLYERAGRFSADWLGAGSFSAGMNLTHDFKFPGNLLSVDARWSPHWAPDWKVSLGTDFFSAASPDGFIGQYVGDDRFRVGVKYEL